MQFHGRITPEIYRRAFNAQGGGLRLLAILLLVAGVLNVFFAIREADEPVGAIALASGLITLGVVLWLMPRLSARKVLSTNKLLQAEIHGDATAERLMLQSAHGTSNL